MKMEVLPVPYDEVIPWLLKRHYAKRVPSISHSFGLFHNNILSGVITFGVPASPFLCVGVCGKEYKDNVLELNRLVIAEGMPKNSASSLIAKTIKLLPRPRILVSYADTDRGHVGYVYQATNWIYTGMTKERTDMAGIAGNHSRHNLGDSSNRVKRSAKHRYVYFHKCPNEIRRNFKYAVEPYPKGDPSRYDASEELPLLQTLF